MVLMVGKVLARLSAIYTDRCCWWCGRFHFSTRQMCASCMKRQARLKERSGRASAQEPIVRRLDHGLQAKRAASK